MNKNLVLLGMMGVGKTTLGKIVARRTALKFIDTDAIIETKNAMTIQEIFKKKGEKFFRMEEKKEILKLLKIKDCVIALGGGAFMDTDIRENILKNEISVWLDVDIKTLVKRTERNRKRPLLRNENNKEKINKIYLQRKNIYELAKYKITCNKLSKEDIVKKITELYEK